MVEGVMFTLSNVTVVPPKRFIIGSIVMVKDPITGSTGAPEGVKPLAVKSIVSVIVAALATFVAPAPNASAQIAANKAKVFIIALLSTDHRSHDAHAAPLGMWRQATQFVRVDPILPFVIRADERRRTKRSDRVDRTGLAVGSNESGL